MNSFNPQRKPDNTFIISFSRQTSTPLEQHRCTKKLHMCIKYTLMNKCIFMYMCVYGLYTYMFISIYTYKPYYMYIQPYIQWIYIYIKPGGERERERYLQIN